MTARLGNPVSGRRNGTLPPWDLQVNHDRSREIGDRFPDDSHRFRDLLDRLTMRFDYRVYMTIGGELLASVSTSRTVT